MTTLAEKRAALHASLEQHIGQVNRHNGAIAILDELIAEEAAREAAEAAVAENIWNNPYWNNNVNAPEDVPPQLAPVVRGTGDDTEEGL